MAFRPDVIAHRGASAHRAEHTLAAYVLALEQGADGLECDVRLTRDGYLVCVHDRRVDRTSTGRDVVSATNLARLAEHDYGSWHDELESSDDLVTRRVAAPAVHPHRGLLLLDDLLGLIADWPQRVQLFVETKHPVRYSGLVEARLVALLGRHGIAAPASSEESPVVAMSFSSRAIRRVRDQAPRLPTVLLLRTVAGKTADGALPPWADIAGPGVGVLRADPGYVERAASHGHPTYCWTVDDPADVTLCRDAGVRYLATNRPAVTRAALERS